MKPYRKAIILSMLAALLVLSPLLASCMGGSTPAAVDKVTLSLGYIPNVQFAPYYVAQDKGYYQQENLEVEIKYGQVTDLLKVVGQGDIQFANVSGDEIVPAKAQGVPVTYIFTQYYKYPVAAAAIASGGSTLKSPADLKGKKVGVPGPFGSTYIGLKALLKAANLSESDITLESIGFTQVEALAQGKVDVAMVFSMNEPVQLREMGNTVDVLEVSQFANLAAVGLVTGDKTIRDNRGLVERFVRATRKGIEDTLRDPDAAFETSMKRTPEISGDAQALQRKVLTATLEFMQPPAGKPLGWSDPQAWAFTEQFIREIGSSTQPVDPNTLFTNDFAGQ